MKDFIERVLYETTLLLLKFTVKEIAL